MPASAPNAVVLLSGGLDSATCLAIARDEGYAPHAITFDYGQRHLHEIAAAEELARAAGATHRTIALDPTSFAGSALTTGPAVPKDRDERTMAGAIPETYVPARNLVFLAIAAGVCEVIGARHLYLGVNAVDYSGYPDCRPEFLEAFSRTANLATKLGVEAQARAETWLTIHAPLLNLTKAQIIQRGAALGIDYARTHSCYDPDINGRACGRCDACILRRRGFEQAGLPDPTPYTTTPA